MSVEGIPRSPGGVHPIYAQDDIRVNGRIAAVVEDQIARAGEPIVDQSGDVGERAAVGGQVTRTFGKTTKSYRVVRADAARDEEDRGASAAQGVNLIAVTSTLYVRLPIAAPG